MTRTLGRAGQQHARDGIAGSVNLSSSTGGASCACGNLLNMLLASRLDHALLRGQGPDMATIPAVPGTRFHEAASCAKRPAAAAAIVAPQERARAASPSSSVFRLLTMKLSGAASSR